MIKGCFHNYNKKDKLLKFFRTFNTRQRGFLELDVKNGQCHKSFYMVIFINTGKMVLINSQSQVKEN